MTTNSNNSIRRRLTGIVVSTAMQKTAVIRVDRQVPNPKYGKYFTWSKKYKVDDPESKAKVGDLIEIEECRPVSKDKCWRYRTTITPAS